MSSVYLFKSSQIFNSAIQILHRCHLTKNISAIKKLHGHLLTTGMLFNSHDFLTQLMATYAACLPENNPQTLNNFFKCMNPTNPLPFNVIMSDFCRKGFPFLALRTLSFIHTNGVPLDTYAWCSALTASSEVKDVILAKQIHAHVGKSGYGEAGLWIQGLELVRMMPMWKLKYDQYTLSAALRACTGLSAIEMGRQLHSYLLRKIHDIGSDVFLQSALIEMYGKCGLVKKAWQIFKLAGIEIRGERSRDLVLWTSMLGVYGRNGHSMEVIGLYNEMLAKGIKPDGIAFLTVISACSHAGQVQAGVKYFASMANDFKLDPGPEHYSCLVDLLCRAGELHKAWELLNETLQKGIGNCSISMWGALLSACVDSGHLELGKLAAQRALELDPQNVGIFIMLSNLYARLGMWDEIGKLRVLIKERGLRKFVGCSWVQVTS